MGLVVGVWLAFRVISEIIPAGLFCISDPQALLILIPLRGMLQIIGCPLRGLPILIPFGKTSLWLREQDLNLQPSGYEPDELPTAPSRDMVEGEGFEPSKALPTDLQSAPFGRLGIPP